LVSGYFHDHGFQMAGETVIPRSSEESWRSTILRHGPLLLAGIIAIIALSREWACSSLLPPNDFPGEVSFFQSISEMLLRWKTIPLWNPFWFNGCSNLFTLSQWGAYPFVLPLTALLGPLTGLKWAVVIFHVLSLITMYCFLYSFFKSRAGAFFGAISYSLFPLQICSGMATGHVVVSLFFALIPLDFLVLTSYLASSSAMKCSVLALLSAMTISFDNEKGLIVGIAMALYTILWAFAGPVESPESSELPESSVSPVSPVSSVSQVSSESQESQESQESAGFSAWALSVSAAPVRVLLKAAVPALLGACLCGFFIIPLLFEMGNFALFPADRVATDRLVFSAPGLGTFLDRFGSLVEFGGVENIDVLGRFSGFHYAGIVLLCVMVAGIYVTLRDLRKDFTDIFRRRSVWITVTLFLFFLISVSLAHGPSSVWSRNIPLFGMMRVLLLKLYAGSMVYGLLFTVGLLALMALPLVTLVQGFRIRGWKGLVVTSSIWIILLFFPLLKLVDILIPLFRNIRSPMWFFNILGGFTICSVAAALPSAIRSIKVRVAVTAFLLLLVAADISPYRRVMTIGVPAHKVSALESLHHTLARDSAIRMANGNVWTMAADDGAVSTEGTVIGRSDAGKLQPWDWRYMALASYSPLDDMGVNFSKTGTSWYWLNWMAPVSTHEMNFQMILPTLYKGVLTPAESSGLAMLMRLSNCPYIIDEVGVGPDLAQDSNFRRIFSMVTGSGENSDPSGNGIAVSDEKPLYSVYAVSGRSAQARLFRGTALYIGQKPGELEAVSVLTPLSIGVVRSLQKKLDDHRIDYLRKFTMVVADSDSFRNADPGFTAALRQELGGRFQVLPQEEPWTIEKPDYLPVANVLSYTRNEPGEIEAVVESERGCLLTVSESWEPGWQVSVNGDPRGTLQVNIAFLGAHIPAGRQKVVFSYRPKMRHYTGAALTVLALMTLFILPLLRIDAFWK
jgi:hypothetical protein